MLPISPRTKRDDYYNEFPSTISLDEHTGEETFNTAGRWCESKRHPEHKHGPLPTSSSLVDSAECAYKRYGGGRVVEDTPACWHLTPGVESSGPSPAFSSYLPHHVGAVKSEATDTVGTMGYGHDVAVALSEARLSQDRYDDLAQAVLDKHHRYGGRIGPEDWFVYTKVGSKEGDPDRHIISEDGLILSEAIAQQIYEFLKDGKSDASSVTASESTVVG